jgi:hypothetical protein
MPKDEGMRELRRQTRMATRAAGAKPPRAKDADSKAEGMDASDGVAVAATDAGSGAMEPAAPAAEPAEPTATREHSTDTTFPAAPEPVSDDDSSIAPELSPTPSFSPEPVRSDNIGDETPRGNDAAAKGAAIAQVLARTEAMPSFEPSAAAASSAGDENIGDFIRSPSHARDDVSVSDPISEPRHAPMAAPESDLQPEPPWWTSLPVLLAILLVALLALATDGYLLVRLNGLSHRVDALSPHKAAVATVDDRPWVGTDTITTANFSNGGQPVTTLHLVNSGRTPAIDLRSNTVGSLRTATAPPPDIPAKPGPLATTGMLLPNTGGKLTFFANTRALTAAEAASVRDGKYVLWLAGRLDYHDKAGHAHTTTFRYRYNPGLGSFVAAPNGNSIN